MDEDIRAMPWDILGSIGDPSGFYFPFVAGSGLLAVNREMLEEALPLTFRSNSFELEDIDKVVVLLICIGHIGRDNIKSLAFGWQSKSEIESTWDEAPGQIRCKDIDFARRNIPANASFRDRLLKG